MALLTPEIYVPDPSLDPERLELAEIVLAGQIDKHLRWVPVDKSPSVGITDTIYGHMPLRFDRIPKPKIPKQTNVEYYNDDISLRPAQEPLNFRAIAGEVLGIDSNCLYFEDRVRAIDGHSDLKRGTKGWYSHLQHEEGLDHAVVLAIKKASELAFSVSALTEHNVPEYKLKTMGRVIEAMQKFKKLFPAHVEWYNGIWIAEERKHDEGQGDYGKIRRLTTTPEHIHGENSQLRTPISIDTTDIFGMSIYTTFQELATVFAHRRNSLLFGPVGFRLQNEESQDESKHFGVYGEIIAAAYKDPRFTEEIIILTYLLHNEPSMPGSTGIPLYRKKSAIITKSKIYSEDQQHEAMRNTIQKFGMLEKRLDANGKVIGYVDPKNVSEYAQQLLNELRQTYDKEPEKILRNGAFVLDQTLTMVDFRRFHKNYAIAQNLPQAKTTRLSLEV